MADASSSTGCLRKWVYRYRFKIQEPESDSQRRGNEFHAEIAQYLRTGVKNLSSLAMAGLHMVPPPGPDLLIEHDMVPDLADGSSGLANAKLRAAGIPLVGAIDLMHTREENYGVMDITEARDPYPTLKILDWKTTSNINNAKSANEMASTLQMAGYGLWAFETFPGLERVRLGHGVFPTKGSPRLTTALVNREHVEKIWNRASAVAVSIAQAAREPDVDKVDANTRACRAYNRDCPARSVCRAGMHNSLSEYIGVTAAERIVSSLTPTLPAPSFDMTQPISPNSLIAHLQTERAKQEAQIAATQPAPFSFGAPAQNPFTQQPTPTQFVNAAPQTFTAPTAPANPGVAMFGNPPAPPPDARTVNPGQPVAYVPTAPAPAGPSPEVLAEMARLEAQAQAAANPYAAVIQEMDRLSTVWVVDPSNGTTIQLGTPQFGGTAAIEVARARGRELQGHGLGGTGLLGKHNLMDPAVLPAALEEMKKMAANAVAAPVAPTTTATMTTQVVMTAPPALLPPDAPASNPLLASKPPEVPAAPGEAPKKRGRKSNAEKAAAEAAKVTQTAPTAEESAVMKMTEAEVVAVTEAMMPPAPVVTHVTNNVTNVAAPAPTPPPAAATSELHFYADCQPDGVTTTSFWPLVHHILRGLAAEDGVVDIRTSEGKHKYNWRGALAAGIRAAHAAGAIPAGHYVIDNAMTDVGSTVVETVRDIIATSGGRFVRGMR